MLRSLFLRMLLLHPPYFRSRFADEMLSIFDHAADSWAEFLLVIDGLVSLVRQWGLRSEFWDEMSSEQPLVLDRVPSFYTLAPFHPRTPAVIHGLLLSVALFWLTCVGIKYSWIHILHVHIPSVEFSEPIASEVSPGQAGTTLKTSAGLQGAGHKVPIALPPPPPTSLHPPVLPDAIAIQKRWVLAIDSSKSQGPARFSVPASNPRSSVEIPLQDYIGRYVVQSLGGLTIRISEQDGCLMMQVAGQPKRALAPVSEAKFIVTGTGDLVEFVADENCTDRNRIRQLRLLQDGQLLIAQRQEVTSQPVPAK